MQQHTFSNGSTASVEAVGRDFEGRVQYTLVLRGGGYEYTDTIGGGCWLPEDEEEALLTAFTFLSAWFESLGYEGSENHDLFSPYVAHFIESDEVDCYLADQAELGYL